MPNLKLNAAGIALLLLAQASSAQWRGTPLDQPPMTAGAASTPTIAFYPGAIVVSNQPAGDRVILFGVTRQPIGVAAVTVKKCLVQVADAEGRATFTVAREMASSCIFAAVNYETGRYALATPAGYPLRLTLFPPSTLKKHGNAYDQLDLDRVNLDILCVRPKKGAWRGFLLDGSALDRDAKANSHLLIDAAQLTKIDAETDDIKDFHEHDVVIMIDAMRMDVMATEVGK